MTRGKSTSRAMQGRERKCPLITRYSSQLTAGYKGAAPRSGIGEFVFVILPAHRAGFPARMEPDMIGPLAVRCGRRPRPRRRTGIKEKRKGAHPTSRHSYFAVTCADSSMLTFRYPFVSKQESKLFDVHCRRQWHCRVQSDRRYCSQLPGPHGRCTRSSPHTIHSGLFRAWPVFAMTNSPTSR